MDLPNLADKFWAYFQLVIDYKAVFFLLLLPIAIFLLGLMVYYTLPSASVWNVLNSSRYWYMVVPLVLVWALVAYLSAALITPPNDNNFYLAFSSFGSSKTLEARMLLSLIKEETRRYRDIAPRLRIQESYIEETLSDFEEASKRGQQRGVHEVVFGTIDRLGASNLITVHVGIGRAWQFSESHSKGEFTIDRSIDPGDTHAMRAVAREIATKILKIFHGSTMAAGTLSVTMGHLNPIGHTVENVFNIGSNLSSQYQARNRALGCYISATFDQTGTPKVSARLLDSDGKHKIEVRDGVVVGGDADKFAVRSSGQYFSIHDSYDRPILNILPMERIDEFKAKYIREKEAGLSLPNDVDPVANRSDELLALRRESIQGIRNLRNITTLTAEIYNRDGIPDTFIEEDRLMQFLPNP